MTGKMAAFIAALLMPCAAFAQDKDSRECMAQAQAANYFDRQRICVERLTSEGKYFCINGPNTDCDSWSPEQRRERAERAAKNRDLEAARIAAYKKATRWEPVTGENGAVFLIDVGHISRYGNGSAEIPVYAKEGEGYDPTKSTSLLFDCQGHFMDLHRLGIDHYAPPNSIVGQIQRIACGH